MPYLKKIIIIILFMPLLAFVVYDYTCVNLPSTLYNYANIIFPSDIVNNLSEMDNMPATNPTTDAGATLGRVLFYDTDLSKNHTIACASCHIQQFGFSDTARLSVGFNGGLTARNSMGLVHARFQKDAAFFWDNRAATLEIQALIPFQSAVEMGMTLTELETRVAAKSFYAPLFQNAFGSTTVTSDKIAKAIAQFVRSIHTFGSKFRKGVEMTNGNPSIVPLVNFTAQENMGKDLFMDETRGNCQACHTRNVMVQQGTKNIGLDLVYADNGVGAATGNVNKNGQFSVPSLINVELTPPYMHDGRYKTLEQVINFYSDSIKAHPNLDGFLREIIPGTVDPNNNPCNTCPPRVIHFTATEKAALLAFLKTLTDPDLATDARWSNPFCKSTVIPVLFTEPMKATKVNKAIEVQWATATELNCDKYEVEKSADGIKFEKYKTVKGNGASTAYHLYKIMDENPLNGTNYYRIKQIDFDEKFAYSKILSVYYDNREIKVFPTPLSKTLYFETAKNIQRIEMTNSMGQVLKVVNNPSSSIDVSDLPFGFYFVRFLDENNQSDVKIIMKN
jgi:cytochrome c peroxidase